MRSVLGLAVVLCGGFAIAPAAALGGPTRWPARLAQPLAAPRVRSHSAELLPRAKTCTPPASAVSAGCPMATPPAADQPPQPAEPRTRCQTRPSVPTAATTTAPA